MWTYKDTFEDYQNYKPNQYFNHFQNNGEMTTKNMLSKNLINTIPNKELNGFFPRTFDLSYERDRNAFRMEFEHNQFLTLLKKTYELFQK